MREAALLIRLFCVLVFVCAAVPRGVAQQARPAPLAAVLEPILEKYHELPGLVGAIVDGNRITALGAVGIRKAGEPERMTAGDLIHLGSDTKAMTATLIGKLFESKRLAPQDTMAEIFADLRSEMNAEMAKVTVAQLLEHTAGLPHDIDWWAIDRSKKSLREQRRMAVETALKKAPDQSPGTKYEYSNVGFVILGAILEEKTGKPWEEVIENELFKPLRMTTAGFGPPGTPGKVDQPWGHVIKEGKPEPLQFDNAPLMGPAGRVHCSISDWGKFVSLYLDPDHPNPQILRAATIHELTTPGPVGDYASGWIVTKRPWAGGTALTHAGSNTMWFCVVWAAPKRHFAVLAATNAAGEEAPKACDDIAGALIKFHEDHDGGR
ncbi:MAG TPA: serine hydrolase domain-containing protein [Pirellulales bacterium]|nr:serine hydrolase domain-containing protein [Pirellulales bacterium]